MKAIAINKPTPWFYSKLYKVGKDFAVISVIAPHHVIKPRKHKIFYYEPTGAAYVNIYCGRWYLSDYEPIEKA